MKLFIVTRELTVNVDYTVDPYIARLVNQLDAIQIHSPGNLNPVIMVDDRYSLPTDSSQSTSINAFKFSDFFFQSSDTLNSISIDTNRIYKSISKVDQQGSYIVIDCGLYHISHIEDLVDKLASTCFQFPVLTSNHLVFVVPLAIQSQIARRINAVFNNLPATNYKSSSNKVKMLLISATLKKVHLLLPTVSSVIVKAGVLFRLLLSRLVRVRG